MDRLIFGDVGYGKTEVALRAAFKAVANGKQVAVLVPTTVLAQQHYETFRRRLAAFPVTVEMLSRLRSDRGQDRILARLKRGEVDIVIGTHRLVQPDVQFKDLGLVIIDEEQRFGVRHKEFLKHLRQEVDVLTMTATPIPRTLNMALSGLRDMSTIDTPPEDRLAVWTQVSPWDDGLVERAIRREMARGGRVFLVHDRVMGIAGVAARLRRLVPEARVAVAHGQLPEGELARVMGSLPPVRWMYWCAPPSSRAAWTSSNANTIIINHADRFGLAQPTSCADGWSRGAVRAYAYLPVHAWPGADRRGPAAPARHYRASELGSGRGSPCGTWDTGRWGHLGRRQSGHISAIGFDLYTRLLAQAVAEEEVAMGDTSALDDQMLEAFLRPLQPSLQLSLPLDAELPESYVSDAGLRPGALPAVGFAVH